MKIRFLEQEYWYGSCVKYGMKMPLHARMEQVLDFTVNQTPNQAMPLLLSTKGRIIWSDCGFHAEIKEGMICVPDCCSLEETGGGLKEAYLYAMKQHFPFHDKAPAMELFEKVIYNTWIELTFFQNETDILAYANNILQSGMPSGVLMIDDGWAEYYGDWRFHSGRFPNPKELLAKLHELGFRVMVWVCPYISADTIKFREAEKLDILVKGDKGEPYIAKWWNGHSAVLDFSNPGAAEWLQGQLEALRELGVDGFKFDAGDSIYYREDNVTYGNVTQDEQSELWAGFGEQYPFNEYRVTFKAGGYALMQRLCDKEHSWGETGVASLIPDTLLQGITGHPYGCPDMIGGGEYLNFQGLSDSGLDEELFVRHSEIACLMPAMQFSAAPYRVLGKRNFEAVKKSIAVREDHITYLMEELKKTQKTGEPLVRYLAYEFPGEPVEQITDQFMLGSRYLVAPVCEKGKDGRKVYLPKGTWSWEQKQIVSDGETVYCRSTPGIPLIFERME